MVKFSKQMELQLVPEWRHKFCDYWQLKKDIKRIKLLKATPPPPAAPAPASDPLVQPESTATKLPPSPAAGDHTSGTWTPLSNFTRRAYHMHPWAHEDIIKVLDKKVITHEDGGVGCLYETQLLEGIAIEEPEKEFLKRLDEELNKVNHFFFAKEHEFLERAEILSRQLASLTEIHEAYNNTMAQVTACALLDSKSSNITNPPYEPPHKPCPRNFLIKKITKLKGLLLSKAHPSTCMDNGISRCNSGGMDSEENSTHPLRPQEEEEDGIACKDHYTIDINGKNEEDPICHGKSKAMDKKSSLYDEEDWALDGLFNHTHVKDYNYEESATCARVSISSIVNALLNQKMWEGTKKQDKEHQSKEKFSRNRSTNTKGALYTLTSQNSFKASMANMKRSMSMKMRLEHLDENCVSLRKIKHARKMLRIAFVEFYRGLGLLQTFSSLNILAFAKILKKYDKVTGRHVSSTYMRVVEKAHFSTSDKVVKMMDEIERLFTEQFAKDDEKKAMMLLRPVQNEAPHTITFFLGLFSGSSLALLMAFAILSQTYKLHSLRENEATYLETTYQVFGMLMLVLLHMYLYGWNVYAWRKARINYAFIFEFAPKTELRQREILLVCTVLTCIVATGMLLHLLVYTSTRTQFNPDVVPLATILVLLLLLMCPLDTCYRSSRVFLIKCMKRVAFSPFYKVFLADFFLADQLTSQITTLRSLQFVMCYYFGGFFQTHNTTACGNNEFRFLAYLISFLPYWWRLMQCLRRWIEEGDRAHLTNGGKYLSAMVAAGARISYSFYPSSCWLAVFVITSSFATLYQMYWDVVRDWGFFQPHSRNPWLRDQLILKNKSTYYFAIVLNFVLRFAWLQQVTHWQKGIEHNQTDLFFAALEVIRRGHWNFYRLENEHLNNVGKYRAVKLVPLPFREEFENHV
ncbi:hypothetical protein GOP47_0011168 [Adiantum capillus-veneris]|uniref:Uncharacterized protein n=1 Tax=Adiantum capillus-veneris TaxID=13818 RepID=A0A9D4US98_ADICA|nr:hypothetical protein GOP47_0011168 [Adiantum capillus-veneris]